MKRSGALIGLFFVLAMSALPAFARSSYVQDDAGMFSPATVSSLNTQIGNFNAQTRKEIVVVTVPSLNGQTVLAAGQAAFSQQQVNGVLIYIAKDDRKDIIIPDRSGVQAGWFSSDTTSSIRQAMEAQFKAEDYDGGISTAVAGVLNVYRSHVGSLTQRGGALAQNGQTYAPSAQTGGFHIGTFWWIVIIVVGFLIIRSLMRSMSGPRSYGPTGAQGGPIAPQGGPGMGYGGFGGGGGGFFSGLLGGLGGAFLGNELFGNRGGGMLGGGGGPDQGGGWGGTAGGAPTDGGGWSNDAGQADMGGSSGGDFGGGGFGGGGDFGGGGGGGSDSGGGW
ncbi:MAG: TPM domain-containing protein [Candidatus Baltobacteraceae bacterium]